jgi:hypothetical protein
MNSEGRLNVVDAQKNMHILLAEKKDQNIKNLEQFGQEAKDRIDGVNKPKPRSAVCKKWYDKLRNTFSTAWNYWKNGSSSSKKPDKAITVTDDDSNYGVKNPEAHKPKYRVNSKGKPTSVDGNENDNKSYNINTLRNALPSKKRKNTLSTLKGQQLNPKERANYAKASKIWDEDGYNDLDTTSLNYDGYGERPGDEAIKPKSLNNSLIVNNFSTNTTSHGYDDYSEIKEDLNRLSRSNSYDAAIRNNVSNLNPPKASTLDRHHTVNKDIASEWLNSWV